MHIIGSEKDKHLQGDRLGQDQDPSRPECHIK